MRLNDSAWCLCKLKLLQKHVLHFWAIERLLGRSPSAPACHSLSFRIGRIYLCPSRANLQYRPATPDCFTGLNTATLELLLWTLRPFVSPLVGPERNTCNLQFIYIETHEFLLDGNMFSRAWQLRNI